MNRENMKRLISYLNEIPDFDGDIGDVHHGNSFFMPDYIIPFFENDETEEPCGTACCIAGFSVLLSEKMKPNKYDHATKREIFFIASEFLGLDESCADTLFNPFHLRNCIYDGFVLELMDVKKKHAIFVLNSMLESKQEISDDVIINFWKESFNNLGR